MAKKHAATVSFETRAGRSSFPPRELAGALADLRYDGLGEYLSALAARLQKDSESDGGRGRGKLAAHLQRAAFALDEARLEIEAAWKICEPYMVSKAGE